MTSRDNGGSATTFRLMTRLFVRRLVDNDLISPHVDRHGSLALVYATVLSLGVFVTFFLSIPYLAALVQLPGVAALSALSDRFLFLAASLSICALGALAAWDALALEALDAAVLGPLPIAPRAIARAKLTAAVVFGALLAMALNAVPSVLYPAFLTLNIRGIRGLSILGLIASQATTTMTAGMFGFFGVLGIRGTLRMLLGERAFQRASSAAQSALVVCAITGLLLALAVRGSDVHLWVERAAVPFPAQPVLWYLGANETLAGHLVAETPIVLPPLLASSAIPTDRDNSARVRYRALLPRLATLARAAWISFPVVTVFGMVTFLWGNRRLPQLSVGVAAPSRIRTFVGGMAERCTRVDPEAQAGFFFAVQTLSRSRPHRTVLASAIAVGLTHALIVVTQISRPSIESDLPAPGLYGIAVMLELLLLGALLHAVNVPAAPAANWTIRMAWGGDERPYLAGVKRAGLALVVAMLAVLLALHVALLGVSVALVHSVLSFVFAMAALDLLFLSYRKLPFACSYVPAENPKIVWPAAVVGLALITYGFAYAERWALRTPAGTFAFAAGLGALAILARVADRTHRRERRPVGFEDRPRPATQRLGLMSHFGIDE